MRTNAATRSAALHIAGNSYEVMGRISSSNHDKLVFEGVSMFPETEKKLAAMSVEDKRAAERWVELNTDSNSLASFIDSFESQSKRPFGAVDAIVDIGKIMLKVGVADGVSRPDFVSSE